MAKNSLESEFSKFLRNQLNVKCVSTSKEDIKYIRCSTKKENVEKLLIEQSITYRHSNLSETPVSGSSRFDDAILIANWQNNKIVIKTDPPGVKQKKLSPNKLIKPNYNYIFADELYNDVTFGLQNDSDIDSETVESCINILNAIKYKTSLILTNTLKNPTEKSKITSDFGEIALAYRRLLLQGGTILFPAASNQSNFDFYHNDIPISAKGQKGSSRFLISGNTTIESRIFSLGESNIEKMFKSWYSRNILKMLEYASYDCKELEYWFNKLGKTIDDTSLKNYILSNSYATFIQDIKSCQNNNILGVPTEKTVEGKYNAGSLHPIKFALLTIWARYYVNQNLDIFNKIAIMLTSDSNIVFEYFNYDTISQEIQITNSSITTYSDWEIVYHSNANSALNNYPALRGAV
jgi:hypothetical protein